MLYLFLVLSTDSCLCCKQESAGHCVCGKQHHDAFPFSKNLDTACRTTWHSCWKLQYKYFSVFVRQSEDSFICILMKSKHSVGIMVLGWPLPPFIFPHIINTKAYIKCLEEIALIWIETVSTGRPSVWEFDCPILHN